MENLKFNNPLVSSIRMERFNMAILKNLKRAGLTKEQCFVRFNEKFVNENWEKF
jgi:hypothetical protein